MLVIFSIFIVFYGEYAVEHETIIIIDHDCNVDDGTMKLSMTMTVTLMMYVNI